MRVREIREEKANVLICVVVCIALGLILLLPSANADELNRNDPITIEKEKDRTVYSIGPGDRETIKEDTDNAWDMLKGVLIDTRGTSGKGPDHNR
jgi:hypothetical protein